MCTLQQMGANTEPFIEVTEVFKHICPWNLFASGGEEKVLSPDEESQLYPAIDLRGGHVVRLRRVDYADETVYGDDPVAVAVDFVEQGSTWIHIVDLDAAKSGDPVNRPIIQRVAAAVAGRANVQTGGGVRSVADAQQLADAGVARVVMGSAAVRERTPTTMTVTK